MIILTVKCTFLSIFRPAEMAWMALTTLRCRHFSSPLRFLQRLLLHLPSPAVLPLPPDLLVNILEHFSLTWQQAGACPYPDCPGVMKYSRRPSCSPAPLVLRLIVPAAAQGSLIRTLTWLGRLYSSWIISAEGQMVFVSA